MEKIYCENCKHFKSECLWEKCLHPNNMKDSHRSPVKETKFSPGLINDKNNCKWFKTKWEKKENGKSS